jgi:hypothetical protein
LSDRFEELVGHVEDPAERERLRHVHELLLSVDPPPDRVAAPARLPERRRYRLALLAAALAAIAFGAGYLAGDGGDVDAVSTISMTGAGEARDAWAQIALLPEDEAGNWPMRVRVSGLPPSGERFDYYELWLTKDGKPIGSCGRFRMHEGTTEVLLTVPYGLRGYDGWVVTRRGSDEPLLTT